MKLTLATYEPHAISLLRKRMRRSSSDVTLTFRHGSVFTQRRPRPVQPRSLQQQKAWSLLTEANRRVASDFANPQRRSHWQTLHSQQSLYKTARGLARAHYITILRREVSSVAPDNRRSCLAAIRTLRVNLIPGHHNQSLFVNAQTQTVPFHDYANLLWFRTRLSHSQITPSSCFSRKNKLPSPIIV